MEEQQKPTEEQLRVAQEVINSINSVPAEQQAEIMVYFIAHMGQQWAEDSLKNPICFHCKEVTPGSSEHWRDCPNHPANAAVSDLSFALGKAAYALRQYALLLRHHKQEYPAGIDAEESARAALDRSGSKKPKEGTDAPTTTTESEAA